MADSALPATTATTTTLAFYKSPPHRVKAFDRHTRMFLLMIKGAIKAWKGDLPTIDKVRPPQFSKDMSIKEMPFGGLYLPTIDEDWPASDWKRRLFLALLRSEYLFPMVDPADAWVSTEEARDVFQEVLPLGSYMARPYHHWKEMQSDAAMSRLAFAGLGALRLMPYVREKDDPKVQAAWQHDLTFMGKYDVRDGFEHYGARVLFDADQRPVAIYWSDKHRWVAPGDVALWEHAKWAWRCSLLVGTTVVDHLVGVHWMIANYVTTAARKELPPTHHLRLLLKPFSWRTITINAGACETLCPDRGFVHRASALTPESLHRAFGEAVGLMAFKTVRQMVEEKGAATMGDQFPWATDALALYEVIHAFVVDYLDAYGTGPDGLLTDADIENDPHLKKFWAYLATAPRTMNFPGLSKDALVAVLSQFIWSVTGLHEAVGTVHEYVLDPTFMGTKIRAGREISDVQASMQCLFIIALTGLQMPKLLDVGDAAGIFDADHRGRAAFQSFHQALVDLSVKIDQANERAGKGGPRQWPCETFNPKHLETGVSI